MSIRATIAKYTAAVGPIIRQEPVEIGGNTELMWFRKLPGYEIDRLRTAMIGDGGTFDRNCVAANRCRLVAKTLCDEDGSAVFDSEEGLNDVKLWPEEVITPIHAAAERVNGIGAANREAVAKNSAATPDAVSS